MMSACSTTSERFNVARIFLLAARASVTPGSELLKVFELMLSTYDGNTSEPTMSQPACSNVSAVHRPKRPSPTKPARLLARIELAEDILIWAHRLATVKMARGVEIKMVLSTQIIIIIYIVDMFL